MVTELSFQIGQCRVLRAVYNHFRFVLEGDYDESSTRPSLAYTTDRQCMLTL